MAPPSATKLTSAWTAMGVASSSTPIATAKTATATTSRRSGRTRRSSRRRGGSGEPTEEAPASATGIGEASNEAQRRR